MKERRGHFLRVIGKEGTVAALAIGAVLSSGRTQYPLEALFTYGVARGMYRLGVREGWRFEDTRGLPRLREDVVGLERNG